MSTGFHGFYPLRLTHGLHVPEGYDRIIPALKNGGRSASLSVWSSLDFAACTFRYTKRSNRPACKHAVTPFLATVRAGRLPAAPFLCLVYPSAPELSRGSGALFRPHRPGRGKDRIITLPKHTKDRPPAEESTTSASARARFREKRYTIPAGSL